MEEKKNKWIWLWFFGWLWKYWCRQYSGYSSMFYEKTWYQIMFGFIKKMFTWL